MRKYILKRAKRKSVSLSVQNDLTVLVKAPLHMRLADIDLFVAKHADWIEKHSAIVRERNEFREKNALTGEEIEALKAKAKILLPQRVAYYSARMGVLPTGVKITSATTRWGSCSGRNGLCFSYRLMLLPPDIVDYVVVHELSHIRVRNHSAQFYQEVERYMPDHRERVRRLKEMQPQLPV